MEGMLKKKNSQGVWKDRYCQLQNSFLMTYKPLADKSGPSDELKETIDLKKLTKLSVTAADMLEITLSTGEFYQYRGAALDVWQDCISKRSAWAQTTTAALSAVKTQLTTDTGDGGDEGEVDLVGEQDAVAEKRNMEGPLKKKNSQGAWKDRFCHLQNVYMITYKPKEKDGKVGPSGEVKETIDLRNLSKTFVTSEGVLEVTLVNGELYEFAQHQQPSSSSTFYLEQWQEAINQRSKWALQQRRASGAVAGPVIPSSPSNSTRVTSNSITSADDENDISAWLLKKSHSKYQGYQVRMIRSFRKRFLLTF